ncbi:MAG TPA: CmcJ/NvfI family oxidoreductase [Steroidobacteraceae bacterium]|nr:CmcJ/NvfI family oxidoreductase [Steroidobacteraceae bacterium]
MTASEPQARTVQATINYVAQGSFINRRFVAPGVEHNTGRYEPHRVALRDARPFQSLFTLDVQGFVLAEHRSAVSDFFDRDEVERLYPNEVVDIVRSLTGATRVAALGWMVRTSGDVARHQRRSTGGYTHRGGVQPPAGEAHVDFMPTRAESLARAVYEKNFPDGKGFSRFIASSVWRAFSPPPQDCPLALCDARSVRPEEGIPNTMFVVDRLPDEQAMLGEMPNEATAPAAAIFHYNPAHRWWYFSNMTRDEVLMFKFHDSDRSKALRTPHTAFQDPSFADARPRESIEVRSIAYFE